MRSSQGRVQCETRECCGNNNERGHDSPDEPPGRTHNISWSAWVPVCPPTAATRVRTCVVVPFEKGISVPVDPKRTAVVLIEYQNDFTSKGGALHGAVQGVMEQTGMLENTRRLVEAARAAGATVVHAPITFAPGYGELSAHPYGILKGVVDSTAFVKGEWGAEIVDALAPQDGDVIVEGKRGLDTFATTNLDFILRARGITTIALGGFLTNCCVESTMRTGYEKGYEVITLSDCVAATSPEEHENAIRFDYPMFSEVMTSEAFAGELQDTAAVSS
jgi:nicotinamidase-related amidase